MRDNDNKDNIYCAGPLTLDRQKKQAHTVMGTDLSLGGKAFDALDMLAEREGDSLAFEELYQAVWGVDETAGRAAAHEAMDGLVQQVGAAGQGFMWIEHEPEAGYTFRTRWAHNRQTWDKPASNFNEFKPIERKLERRSRPAAARLFATGIMAAVLIFAFAAPDLLPPANHDVPGDEQVPLAAPDFRDETANVCFETTPTDTEERLYSLERAELLKPERLRWSFTTFRDRER